MKWRDLETRAYYVHLFRFHDDKVGPMMSREPTKRPYARETAWTGKREERPKPRYSAETGYEVTEGMPDGKVS
ncbi:MAG: hypothetical protein ACREQ5_06055 [Candidatus Dormibacteria bacterium]